MFKSRSGFTLIEILIAIAIVATFITIPVLAYSNYSKTQRDIKRKSDVNQVQQALEQYKSTMGAYPTTDNWEEELISRGYLTSIPEDPYEGRAIPDDEAGLNYTYSYSSTDPSTYKLVAHLEDDPNGKWYITTPNGSITTNQHPTAYNGGSPAQNTPIPSSTIIPTASNATNTPVPDGPEDPGSSFNDILSQTYDVSAGSIRRMVLGPDSNIWYVKYSQSVLGKVSQDGTKTEMESCHSSPLDLVFDNEDKIWLIGSSPTICSMDISSGSVVDSHSANTSSNRSVTLGPDNKLWYTTQMEGLISTFALLSGIIEEEASAPQPLEIVKGTNGYMWYLTYNGLGLGQHYVGRVNIQSKQKESFVSFPYFPNEMTMGTDNKIYVAANTDKLLRYTNEGELEEVPVELTAVYTIAAGNDGNIWYGGVDGTAPKLGRYNPSTNTSVVFDVSQAPEYMIAGVGDTLWYASGNSIVKVTH